MVSPVRSQSPRRAVSDRAGGGEHSSAEVSGDPRSADAREQSPTQRPSAQGLSPTARVGGICPPTPRKRKRSPNATDNTTSRKLRFEPLRSVCAPSPPEAAQPAAALPEAVPSTTQRAILQNWVRRQAPESLTCQREAIIAGVNNVNQAAASRGQGRAVWITPELLEQWTRGAIAASARDIPSFVHPFAAAFSKDDVVLGVAEMRERLVERIPEHWRGAACADSVNAMVIFAHLALDGYTTSVLRRTRPDFARNFDNCQVLGTGAPAQRLWTWISRHPAHASKVMSRVRCLQAACRAQGNDARLAFYDLSRTLCKLRILMTLDAGNTVHFEFGDFRYQEAVSKNTTDDHGTVRPERREDGHFTASELRLLCAIWVQHPNYRHKICFYRNALLVTLPADIWDAYVQRNKALF